MNLKTFGCLYFSYVPQVKRNKLDKKLEPGIFIGYSSTSKAYKIYLPQTSKIVVSRDVKFLEWGNGAGMSKISSILMNMLLNMLMNFELEASGHFLIFLKGVI